MDKNEYKEYLAQLRRQEQLEKERHEAGQGRPPYSPFWMKVRMPLGCWLWVALAIAAAIYFVKRVL
jgi:hypothetical protein